jgi:hypothetical protein
VNVLGALIFAAFVTAIAAHVALVAALFTRGRKWRALLAVIAPVLAPYWGWQEGMRRRVMAWGVAVAIYVLGVVIASFTA